MKGLLNWISDLLWPLTCIGCGAPTTRLCGLCAGTLAGGETLDRRSRSSLNRLLAAGSLRQTLLSRAIWHLKYRNAPDLAEQLGNHLATAAGNVKLLPARDTIVVPVPLHPARLRERGYNQAELLARQLATIGLLPCWSDVLARIRRTASQVESANREERLVNMAGAFACVHPELVGGRHVFLVDDVCTTGATLEAAATALKTAGARTVTGIVLAKG